MRALRPEIACSEVVVQILKLSNPAIPFAIAGFLRLMSRNNVSGTRNLPQFVSALFCVWPKMKQQINMYN